MAKITKPAKPTDAEEKDEDETFVVYVSGYKDVPQPDGSVFKAPVTSRVTQKAYHDAGLG